MNPHQDPTNETAFSAPSPCLRDTEIFIRSSSDALRDSPSRLNPATEVVHASLGVRGLICLVDSGEPEPMHSMLEKSLKDLRELGVRRVHIIIPAASRLGAIAEQLGFAIPVGESLFVRELSTPPSSEARLPAGFSIRDATPDDVYSFGTLISKAPELAFEQWEIGMLTDQRNCPKLVVKVLTQESEIVGVAIGGSSGPHGTISHLWIAPDYRKLRLGQALSEAALGTMFDNGARTIHLMTVQGNEAANKFWERQGFKLQSERYFVEKDL